MFAAGVRDEFPGSASRRGGGTASTGWRSAASLAAGTVAAAPNCWNGWTDELNDVADELKHLVQAHAAAGCPADRAKQEKVLREAMNRALMTPDELDRAGEGASQAPAGLPARPPGTGRGQPAAGGVASPRTTATAGCRSPT